MSMVSELLYGTYVVGVNPSKWPIQCPAEKRAFRPPLYWPGGWSLALATAGSGRGARVGEASRVPMNSGSAPRVTPTTSRQCWSQRNLESYVKHAGGPTAPLVCFPPRCNGTSSVRRALLESFDAHFSLRRELTRQLLR